MIIILLKKIILSLSKISMTSEQGAKGQRDKIEKNEQ